MLHASSCPFIPSGPGKEQHTSELEDAIAAAKASVSAIPPGTVFGTCMKQLRGDRGFESARSGVAFSDTAWKVFSPEAVLFNSGCSSADM